MLAWFLLASVASAKVPTRMPPDPQKGAQLYGDDCWQCHGKSALGDGPAAAGLRTPAPPLAGRVDPDHAQDTVAVIEDGKGDMPAFSQVMDRYDARRIVIWLATLDPKTGEPPKNEGPNPPSTANATGDDAKSATPAGALPAVHPIRPRIPPAPATKAPPAPTPDDAE